MLAAVTKAQTLIASHCKSLLLAIPNALRIFLIYTWPPKWSFGNPGIFFLVLGPPLWILNLFQLVGYWGKVGGLSVIGLLVTSLGVVHISSSHISLAGTQTSDYKDAWQMWLSCVTRQSRQRR